ncbi:hypothetical protein Tco_0740809 [Tanacetum coccineum]
MLKVANISTMPEQNLILPSKEVNAGNTINKTLFGDTMQPYAEESVATTDATKSLEASESAEELRNQPKPVNAEKLADLISNFPHVYVLGFDLKAYSDSDYAGCNLDRKGYVRDRKFNIANISLPYLWSPKLINDKKKREVNVCYTRYSSLIIEHLLGKDYKNDKLKTFKPYHISATSFKTPSANEVSQIPHMLKVSNISTMPKQNLILPSKVENVGNTINKTIVRGHYCILLTGQKHQFGQDRSQQRRKNPSFSEPKDFKI